MSTQETVINTPNDITPSGKQAIASLFRDFHRYCSKTLNPYSKNYDYLVTIFTELHETPARLNISAQIELKEFSHLLYNLLQLGKPQSAHSKEFKNINQNFERILRNFSQYKVSYTEISNKILNRLSAVEEIHKIIEKMKVIAKEIKIFSINSVIIASQAGKQGTGFKSISRFIIELSDTIQKSALQLELYKDKIINIHALLKEQFSTLLDDIYGVQIEEIQNATQNSVIWAEEDMQVVLKSLEELFLRITEALNTGTKLAEPFLKSGKVSDRIPTVVYMENMLKVVQSFTDRINKVSTKNQYEELVVFFSYVTKEALNKFSTTSKAIDSFKDKVLSSYIKFIEGFGTAQQDDMYILNYLISPTVKENSLLGQIFYGIKNNIKNFQSLLNKEKNVKDNLIDTFLEIEKIHQEGLSIFSNFEKFLTTMNNINVLAQIEINKNQFTNNVNLKNKFNTMLSNLKSFNNDVKNHIQKMLTNLIIDMNQFSDLQAEQSSFLRNTDAYFDREVGSLDFSLLSLNKTIHNIKEENSKIFNSEVAAKNLINTTNKLATDFLENFHILENEIISFSGRFQDAMNFLELKYSDSIKHNYFVQEYAKLEKEIMGNFEKNKGKSLDKLITQ